MRLRTTAPFLLSLRLFLSRTGAGLFLLCAAALGAGAPGVELMVNNGSLTPSSTIEVRFPLPMVSQSRLGKPGTDPPLIFTPQLPGKFTWLSTRSGVYVPTESPRLGTAYKVTFSPGLADAGGHALPADFQQTLKTPPFRATVVRLPRAANGDCGPLPDVFLAFNLNINAAGAEKRIQFVSDTGVKIAAKVRYATSKDYSFVTLNEAGWEKLWRLAKNPGLADAPQAEESAEFHDRIIATPAEPLTPGLQWSMTAQPGIESLEGGYKTEGRSTLRLRVTPFSLKSVATSSYLNSGRKVTLQFSDQFSPNVENRSAGKFFRVTPEPAHMQFDAGYEAMTIEGDFQRGVEYRVEIDPSLMTESLNPFWGERFHTFHFDPIRPRVYLPKITADELRGGGRKFSVRGVNLESFTIRAVLVAPEAAAQAMAAFAKYWKPESEAPSPDEPYQSVPPGLIQGTTLPERTVELPKGDLDLRQEIDVDWNDLLGPQKPGLVFLTVEGSPLPAAGGGAVRPAAQALIQLTDLGVLWKRTDAGLRVGVFSMATGKPVEGAALALLGPDFAPLSSGTSGPEGLGKLALDKTPGWLVVSRGGDVNALRMGEGADELPMAHFNLPIDYRSWNRSPERRERFRALVFTDRPLSPPGRDGAREGNRPPGGRRRLEMVRGEERRADDHPSGRR